MLSLKEPREWHGMLVLFNGHHSQMVLPTHPSKHRPSEDIPSDTRTPPPMSQQHQGLYRQRKADGGVDISLGNMEAEAICHQHHADQHQE